jgi:predicted deacetylase
VKRRHEIDRRTIAVALHDIEPATFERCALIRDWLDDHGVDRATLLVIPARDLHPLGERSPEMVEWLRERECRGDAIAQHGFHHLRARRGSSPRERLADLRAAGVHGSGAEFVGLDASETRRAVESGRRVLKLAGIEPQGFVAPAYAYTAALREVLSARFRWWAELMHLRRAPLGDRHAEPSAPAANGTAKDGALLFPPITFSTSGPMRRALAPALVRAGALIAGGVLRLDLHPSDLDHTRHMLALEWVLGHAHRRHAVTYDELAGVTQLPGGGNGTDTPSGTLTASLPEQGRRGMSAPAP